jgi:hypothetical protein
MTLKKTDKLIAVIGVIILIIAGLGIILYTGGEKKDQVLPPVETKNTYIVTCSEVTISRTLDSVTIKPKIIGWKIADPVEIPLNQQNLKSIEIIVTYKDRSGIFPMIGLLKRIGADTLAFGVLDTQGNEIGGDNSKGDKEIPISKVVGQRIELQTIEAETLEEAQEILKENYIDYQETYTVECALKTGFIGKIRERFIGQHRVDLAFNYTYYEYDVELLDGEPPELPPTGYQPGPSQGPYTATNQALTKH